MNSKKSSKLTAASNKSKVSSKIKLATKNETQVEDNQEELEQDAFSFSDSNEQHGQTRTHKNHKHNKSALVGDIQKTIDYLSSSSAYLVNNCATATNATTNLAQQLLSAYSSSASKAVEQNVAMTQDLLKCKDIVDTINAQQKFLQANFDNALNLMLGVSDSAKQYAFKNIDSSVAYLDRNLEEFTK